MNPQLPVKPIISAFTLGSRYNRTIPSSPSNARNSDGCDIAQSVETHINLLSKLKFDRQYSNTSHKPSHVNIHLSTSAYGTYSFVSTRVKRKRIKTAKSANAAHTRTRLQSLLAKTEIFLLWCIVWTSWNLKIVAQDFEGSHCSNKHYARKWHSGNPYNW